LQRQGREGTTLEVDRAIMMWNPPWTLPLLIPMGLVPLRVAQFLWLVLQLTLVARSVNVLWNLYGGESASRPVSWIMMLIFAPTVFLLFFGQITGFLLAGLTGFLWAMKRERYGWAGFFGALTAIKPHLFPLFVLGLLMQGPLRRKAIVLVSGAGTLLGAVAISMMFNPHILTEYTEALRQPTSDKIVSLADWEHPTLGFWLRWAIDLDRFWLMFVPMILAVAPMTLFWIRHGVDWMRDMPTVVFLNLLTAAYGAWTFDLLVLLIPMTLATIHLCRMPRDTRWLVLVVAFFLVNLWAISVLRVIKEMVILTPCYMALFYACYWISGERSHSRGVDAG
jgi:hypothetical protein